MNKKEILEARLDLVQQKIEHQENLIELLERDEKRLLHQIRLADLELYESPVGMLNALREKRKKEKESLPDDAVQIPPALSEKRKKLQKLFIFLSGKDRADRPGRKPMVAYLDQIRGVLGEVRRKNQLQADEDMTSFLTCELETVASELETKFKGLVVRIKSEDF